MDPIDVKIIQLNKQEFKDLQSSQLTIEISGKSVNSSLVNTLRRASYDIVPTYAFPAESIYIEKNTSIYNNDYMKLRLSQLTIPKIENNIYYLEDKYWKNIKYDNPEREKHPNDKKILEFYVNMTNSTKGVLNVTTEHSKTFEDGVEMKDKFDHNYPCLIIKLRPGESFSCRCVGVLGVGKNNNIWAASGNSYFDQLEENKFKLTLESQGQIDEYDILYKSCIIIKEKLDIIKKLTLEKHDLPEIKETTKLSIIFENEDHTMGNLINEFLQENKDVVFSGLSKPNLVVDTMVIDLETIKNDPLKTFLETIKYIDELFSNIENKIEKLGNKFIKK